MSKLKINFNDYKASGVYFIEKDNSIINSVDTTSGRLAVGFSKKGPFNAPVYLDDTTDAAEVFGGPDTKLERKGVFFNRSLQTLISKSPVYALNLLPFDEDEKTHPELAGINKVGTLKLGESGSIKPSIAATIDTINYQDVHETSRFWTPSAEHLAENAKYVNSFINFANVSTEDFTVIVRKAEDVKGYGMPVRDWYETEDKIPYAWMKASDLMSDYFIQVICVAGDWTDAKLAYDSFWKEYFTEVGGQAVLKRDKISKFMQLDQVELIGDYTGCILPEFYDKSGILRSIQDIINTYTQKTGLLMSTNVSGYEEASEGDIDMVGRSVCGATSDVSCQFMSYDFVYDVEDMKKTITSECSLVGNTLSFYGEDASLFKDLTVGSMVGVNGELTRIVKKRKYAVDTSVERQVYWEITVFDGKELESVSNYLYVVPAITDCYSTLKPYVLKGLDIDKKIDRIFNGDGSTLFQDNEGNSYLGPDAPIARIYNVLNDKGIRRGLLNRAAIDYRYIIDTMGHGLGEMCGSKKMVSKLAKDHQRCLAFISAPSMTEFAKCEYAAFYDVDDPYKTFDTKYIPMGGNDEAIKNVEFSMIDENNGSKYCAVFGPYLKYRSGSAEILVPPAADVANAYMAKFNGGDPYVTVANLNGILNNGKIRGVEYDFDDTDRGYLEPFGINPIIRDGSRVMIYGDRSAFQNYITDYNYIHVREILNTIEIECNAILKNYVFTYNNAQVRSEIYKKINPILSTMKEAGALYKYELEMDENNNTEEIIDRSFAVIDLGVWITKNMEKIIAHITVNKLSQD